jgi:hypothetical protein
MRNLLRSLLAAFVLAATAGMAFADDWTVTRLRGTVEQLVDGQWQPLERGNVVPDERSIFTRANGHATLVRGNEAIELGPNTKIEIYDQGGRKPFTTILQHAGVLTVEAEVRNVQHFAVRTTYLAAVVKGTRFTVTARSTGSAVEVFRGQVSVTSEANGENVLVPAGQKVKVDKGGDVTISGKPKAGAPPAATTTTTAPQQGRADTTTTTTSSSGGTTSTTSTSDGGTGVVTKTTTTVDKVVTKTTDTVEKVVTTTTKTVDKVVTTTTNTVEKVVDKTTDTVDDVADTVDQVTGTTVVGDTVSTVTDTVDKTTGVLTGLLGKKKKK